MILKGKIRLLSYKHKSFPGNDGKQVTFISAEFCDDEGNKFTGSVPKDAVDNIEADAETFDSPREGDAVLDVTRASDKSGKQYTKIQLIAFK
jgi:hypothetical protein